MICPRCRTAIRLRDAKARHWCPKHTVFFCPNCVRQPKSGSNRCPVCHTSTVGSSNFFLTLFALIGVLALVGAVYFYSDVRLMEEIQSAPLVPVASAEVGQFVRLDGKIVAPPGTVVISGYNPGGKGGMWSYQFKNFYLSDGNGSIYVDMGSVGTNVLGHGPNGTANTVVFSAGDSLALAGTVATNGTGKFLQALRAADSVGDLYDPSAIQVDLLLWIVGSAGAAGFAYLALRLRQRLRKHRDQVESHPPSFFAAGPEPTSPSAGEAL